MQAGALFSLRHPISKQSQNLFKMDTKTDQKSYKPSPGHHFQFTLCPKSQKTRKYYSLAPVNTYFWGAKASQNGSFGSPGGLWAMLVPSGAPVNTYFEVLGPVLGLLWGPLGHLSGPSWAPGWPPKLGLEAQCQKTPFYRHSNYENMPPVQTGALFSLRHPISKQSQGSSDSFGNPWISVHGRSSPYIIPYSPIQFV